MADTGIRINEIPRDSELNDGDLLHVYKEVNGVFKSVSAPVESIAFRGPKGEPGQPGEDGYEGGTIAQLVVYRRIDPTTISNGAVDLLKPGYDQNDDGSYDFKKKVFTPPQNPRWYKNVPPVEAGKEDYVLYSASGVAQIIGTTGIDNNIEWSDPEPDGIQGLPGSPGKSTYQAVIFTRSATVPPTPTGGTFNFGKDKLTPPEGWFIDVGGDLGPKLGNGATDDEEAVYQSLQLWMCNHQFSIVGDEGIDTAGNWSLPTRFASDGADGFSTYFGSIYKRTNEVGLVSFTDNISEGLNYMPRPGEGDPTKGGEYDFRLNKFILPDGPGEQFEGWTEEVPDDYKVAGRSSDLWISHTVASARSNFIGNEPVRDDSLKWTWPKKVSQATIDGNQGNAVAQVKAYIRSVGDAPLVTSLAAAEFNFQDKILNLQGTGWSSEPYKSTLEDSNADYGRDFLYVAVGIAESVYNPETAQYPNDTDIQWGDPVPAPDDGEVAVSTYLAQVYTRYSGSEDIQVEGYIPTGGSYNFGENSIGLPTDPNNELTWSSTIPAGAGQIYVSQRNFNVRGNTGTDVADSDNPWSIPAILAYDGVAGFDGVTNTRITLYYGSDTQLTGNNIPTIPADVNIAVDLDRNSSNFGNVLRTEINGEAIDVTSDHKILTKNGNNNVDTGWRTEMPGNDWIYSIQALASDSDETDDNYIDIIASNEWGETAPFRKPGGQGLTGLATSIVSLYKRTSSSSTPSPSKPTGSFRYYLGDEGSNKRGELIEIESADKQGWSLTAPSYDGSNHYLWQISATASSRDNYDVIPDTEWISPIIFSQNPFDLTETTVSHIVQAYIRSSVVPITNPGTCTVNLSGETAGQITGGLLNGWSDVIPDGDQQVYIVHATASGSVSNINDIDTIAANEWSAPAKWGIVGERGLRGASGGIGRPLTLFKRTDLTPVAGELDLPTLSGTYDFVSDNWTFGTYLSNGNEGTINGWSYELPSKDTTDRVLWQTFATAISTQDSSSDIILSDDWSLPRATSQDGAVTPIYSTVENPTTVAQCSLIQTNSDFAFISFYNYPIADISSLTDNVIEDLVFIKMLGQDGTSINIKDSLDSVDNLPSSNNSQGDSYLISGDLYVYSGTEFVDAGTIQGPSGLKGEPGADGSSSYLHIAYADDEFGTNFTTDNKPGDRSFLGTYTDSTELDSTDHDDYTWVKIVGKDGSAGRPNGCEAVYGYGNSEGPSSITYLEDENVLQLKGETDTNTGMVYPAFDVSDGRKLRFTVTYKTPDTPVSSGIYIRLYEATTDLAEGKDRVGHRSYGDNSNSSLIQQYNRGHLYHGYDTSYIKITPSGSDLENGPVPGEYTTRTIEYTPRSDSRYVSLTILNWSGLGTERLWVKPVITTVIGEKGDTGEHGFTSRIVEIFRSVPLTQSAPSRPTDPVLYNIATGSLLEDSIPSGWKVDPDDATSGTKIYRCTALVTYSADQTSGVADAVEWSDAKAWSVGAGRTAPVVSRLANYKYFDSNFSTSNNSQSPTNAYYSFRQSGGESGDYNNGWGPGVTTSTSPITDIKQILFNIRGADNVDYTDFWKGFDTASELLWKYGSSWIIFKRTEQVDTAGDWTGVRVEVIDHSDDISQIKDLPGFHTSQDDPLEADVVFGYTPTIIRETVFLHKRSGATAPGKPTSNLVYNFNTSSFTGALNSWTVDVPSSGGKYLWRIQATADAKLNIGDGVYKDDIPSSEWSSPRILAQDGIDGSVGNTYFQKFLYTRTSTSAPDLKTNWVNGNKPRQVQVTVDGTGVSESIGDVKSASRSNLTSTYGVVWSESIPDESNGQFLWVTVVPVTSSNTSTNYITINSSQWTEPVLLTKDGVGLNSATVRLYKRTSGNVPTGGVNNNNLGFKVNGDPNPSNKPTFTYNFSNGNIDNKDVNMNGWYRNIPETGGSTLWVSRAVASSTGTTDEIPWSEWQAPDKLVTDGTSLIFIGSFATRTAYKSHINSNYDDGIPPYNSYHIETVSGLNVSYLYIGGQNSTDKNSNSNFQQLTIDGANGTNGQDGLSFEFKGTVNRITNVSNPRVGDVYRVTGSNNSEQGDPRDNSAPAILVYKSTGWAVLTTDGSPGADSTVRGPNGNSVFITYSSKLTTDTPTKPADSNDGNVSGVWTTTPSGNTRYNWMSQKIAQNNTSGAWGPPIQISGEDGETGFRTLEIAVYQRSEVKPGTPSASGNNRGAYDFWNRRLLPPSGWSSTIKNAGIDRESSTVPNDPKDSYGYEYKYASGHNWNNSNTWDVLRVDNSSKANLPLWKMEATVSVVANTSNIGQIDASISWSPPAIQELNGVDLIDNSVDVDRVYQAVKNGGGVEKIVATDRQDPPQLLTQAAYDALSNTEDPTRSQYGWTYNATSGYDTVHDDTLYIIF